MTAKPPRAADLHPDCPNPDMQARHKDHFGGSAWEFECPYAEEAHIQNAGITISCSRTKQKCLLDNNQDIFVNAPENRAVRDFLDSALRYFTRKE